MACWPASKVGQLLVLLPTSLDLTPRAAELGSLVTHEDVASIGMPCFAAPGAESNSAGRRRRAAALGYQIQGAVIQRCHESPDASIRPGSIASKAQSKRLPPQNLGRSAAIRAACTRATAHSHHSHHCAVSHQSRLKRARRSGLFAATRQHCQFFCSARRWPPKRRP